MRTFARINAGAIAELLATDQDITRLFHPALHWVDVTGKPVEPGWLTTATGFVAPPPLPTASAPVTLAQIAELTARVATLTAKA
jgi:hypothetical protein